MGLNGTYRVGVDIGSTAVRVAEVGAVGPDGYAQIRRAASVPVPPEAVAAGKIRQPVLVGQALAAALSEAGVPRSGFVLSATTSVVALSRQEIPTVVLPHERELTLRNSNTPISPMIKTPEAVLALSEVRVLPATGDRPERALVNVAAIPKDEMATLERVCQLAGADPRAIDLPASGLFRSMVRFAPGEPETVISTIVDVGATKILVATREGRHLRSVRLVGGASLEVTRALMATIPIENPDDPAEEVARFNAAEAKKARLRVELGGTGVDAGYGLMASAAAEPTTAEEIINNGASQMIEKIVRAVASDAETNGRRLTQGVQLTGGGARMRGFAEALQARLGVPVVLTAPWAKPAKDLPPGTRAEDYSTAVGLALLRSQR
jgi:type IV pilus assembly protein PilM